jgi:endonuclease/exonuclease/phosphatase family metal-dependent hydrolase
VVATANVLFSLPRHRAAAALDAVLDHAPDLVGLQEWGPRRIGLLRRTGRARWQLGPVRDAARSGAGAGYTWTQPLAGGCPVGARADRYDLLSAATRLLAAAGWSDPGARPVRVLPPRFATVAVFRDRQHDRTVSVVNYHLVPGTQSRGSYREDRPLLAARHRTEVRRLAGLVTEQLALGHVVHAMGDSNFDGLRLPGLTSAWVGREDGPGTLGSRRKIDDVHGPGPADEVTLLVTPSDHQAVLVRRDDRP